MATLFMPRLAPAGAQIGQTAQRLAGCFFLPLGNIPELAGLPLNIGATTVTTSVMNVVGFNTFNAYLDVTVAGQITFKVNFIDPRDQAAVLSTATIQAVVSGTGLTLLTWGFGNTVVLGGANVYAYISLAFTGSIANATINQFPGVWGCVR